MTAPSQMPEGTVPALSSDAQIDAVCDEFETALRSGKQPSLLEFLARVAEVDRPRLFAELLYVEFEFQPPPVGEDAKAVYLCKYPEFAAQIQQTSFVDEATDTTPYHRPVSAGPPRPRDFANFQLEALLGTGAMGEVWKAYDQQLDRWVAVKIPRRDFATDEERRRFMREGRAAAQLRHPNIVQVHEVAHTTADVYIVSDYIEGGDLRTYLDANRLSYAVAAELAATIARALHYAHNRDIIHRDLKPANVLMDAEGQPHITDFGLAKWSKDAAEMTVSGQVLGTPAYMSPEQARGRASEVDRRSDVYALGVLLYEMITGRLPFTGDVAEVLRAIAVEPPNSPRSIRRDIPRDLATICLKAMEKEPARRYPTALALADDLHRFLAGEPIAARPVSPAERLWRWCKRHPAVAVALLLLMLLFAAAATAYRQRAQFRQAADLRDVVMDTNPSGADVVFVPLDRRTGLPVPDRLIRAGHSPISMSLPPGDYLVVAAHANGKFHEVLRHVPRSDEGLAGGTDTYFYIAEPDGTIRLPLVKLWDISEIRGMVRLEAASPPAGRKKSLYVDRQEMLAGDLEPDFVKFHHMSANEPYISDFYISAYCAEHVGKRVPTAPEFRWILAACDAEGAHGLFGLFSEPWEWASTPEAPSNPPFTEIGGPFDSALGDNLTAFDDLVTLYGGSSDKLGHTVHKFGEATAAIRPVRSVHPRMQADDF